MSARTVVSEDTGVEALPPQAGVQPPESSTNARFSCFSPALTMSEIACGLLSSGMKYAGWLKPVFGGGGGVDDGDVEGVVDGVVDGGGVVDGFVEGVVDGVVGPLLDELVPPGPSRLTSSA